MKPKSLTEGGQLRTAFNATPGSIRPSVRAYQQGLETALINKEIMEYVSRFKWSGLPSGMNGNILETMLYVKGQIVLFKVGDKHYLLPFVFTGPINHLGIQTSLIPLSYSGALNTDDRGEKETRFADARTTILFDLDDDIPAEEAGVILKSHSSLFLNQVVPMVTITSELRAKLIEALIVIRNNLILSQPMKYISVATESDAKAMRIQLDNMLYDILNGDVVQTITGTLNLGDVNSEVSSLQQQGMWQSYASLDNLRMEIMGILNNGVFEKRERNLTDEVAGKQTVSRLILDDQLQQRKNFCKLANKYFGLNISVELSDMNNPLLDDENKEKIDEDRRDGQFNPGSEVVD